MIILGTREIMSSSFLSDLEVIVISGDGKVFLEESGNNSNSIDTYFDLFKIDISDGVRVKDVLKDKLKQEFRFLPQILLYKEGDRSIPIVKLDANSKELICNTNKCWCDIEDTVDKNISFIFINNLSRIINFISSIVPDIAQKYEHSILQKLRLIKKNNRVFYSKDLPFYFKKKHIYMLKELARFKKIPLFRVCLHCSDRDLVHEMLMIHTKPQYIKPHCTKIYKNQNKTVSYHVIDGESIINIHDDDGNVIKEIAMSSSDNNKASSCRLNANIFRSMRSLTDSFLFLETSSGPFNDSDTVWLNYE